MTMEILDSGATLAHYGLDHLRELASFGALTDAAICTLFELGTVKRYDQGDYVIWNDEHAEHFHIMLEGKMAYYKRADTYDVLTRHWHPGDTCGFDSMIGLTTTNGTDVAVAPSVVLEISKAQFFELHQKLPMDFGLFMINLSREMAREIAMLEDTITRSTGWRAEP